MHNNTHESWLLQVKMHAELRKDCLSYGAAIGLTDAESLSIYDRTSFTDVDYHEGDCFREFRFQARKLSESKK